MKYIKIFALFAFIVSAPLLFNEYVDAAGLSQTQPDDGTRFAVGGVGDQFDTNTSVSRLYVPGTGSGSLRFYATNYWRFEKVEIYTVSSTSSCQINLSNRVSQVIDPGWPNPEIFNTSNPAEGYIDLPAISGATKSEGGYRTYCIVTTVNSSSVMNFRLEAGTGELIGNDVSTNQGTTGFVGDGSPSSADPDWSKTLDFAPNCAVSNTSANISFYDLDLQESWQTKPLTATVTQTATYPTGTSSTYNGGDAPGSPQNYYEGVENEDRSMAVTFNSGGPRRYRLVLSPIAGQNAIKIAIPYDQIYTIIDCPSNTAPTGTVSVSCTYNSGAADAVFTVSYDLDDKDGDSLTLKFTDPNNTVASIPNLGNTAGSTTYTLNRRAANYSISGVSVSDDTVSTNITASPASDDCPLPAKPVLTIGTYDCKTINYSFTDPSDEGFKYSVVLTGPGPTASTTVSKTDLSEGSHSFTEVAEWRDFRQNDFNIKVTNKAITSLSDSKDITDIPRCVTMVCNGATIQPANLEVNRPFSIAVNFGMRFDYVNATNTGTNGTIGPRGQQITYDVNITVTPAPGVNLANPVVNDSTITKDTNSNIQHIINGYSASNTPTNYTVKYKLEGVNNSNATTPECTVSFKSAKIPYTQLFGGDVIAGYGVKNQAGICSTNASSIRAMVGTSLTSSTEIVGSGTQMAVFALGSVKGFRSAITDAVVGTNGKPWERIFANSSEAGNAGVAISTDNFSPNYGGLFNSSLCAENWLDDIPTTATPFTQNADDAVADIDVKAVLGVVRYDGDVRLNASGPLEGTRKIYVNGNVIIGNAFTPDQELVYGVGPWNTVLDIPSFTLIATGDIIIDDNVTKLDGVYVSVGTEVDGVYVSGGTVFTCSPTQSILPSKTQSVTQFSPDSYKIGGTCNTVPLSFHGAIVANSIRLWRTGGTISKSVVNGKVVDSTGTQTYLDGLTGAETFMLPPEVFVSPRFGEEPANGSAGKKQLDSLISLPPPF